MSRSGYGDDCENVWLYRKTVENAINGKRGQAFLRELLAALDAMPVKRLITDELVDASGEFCTLGVVGAARGIDMAAIDYTCPRSVGNAFGIARCLAAEIEFENDESYNFDWYGVEPYKGETPEGRWERMRRWVAAQIKPTTGGAKE